MVTSEEFASGQLLKRLANIFNNADFENKHSQVKIIELPGNYCTNMKISDSDSSVRLAGLALEEVTQK